MITPNKTSNHMRKRLLIPSRLKMTPLLLFILIDLSACWSSKTSSKLEEVDKIVALNQGPCFGRCPIYTLTVYQKGLVTYEGERNTDRLGKHFKEISQEQYEAILQLCEAIKWEQLQRAYSSPYPDLPTIKITYFGNQEAKAVIGKGPDGRPEKVIELQDKLMAIAQNAKGWEQQDGAKDNLPGNVIADEIIVQFDRDLDAKAWAQEFSDQGLQVIRSLSPSGQYWLMSYDRNRIAPQEMLRQLRQHPDVFGAEFNKRLEQRGN